MLEIIIKFLLWYVAIQVIGLIGLPFCFKLFSHLPDRGFSFSKILGMILFGFSFWILNVLRFLNFDQAGSLATIVFLAMIGWVGLRRSGYSELKNWLVIHRSTIIFVELVFLIALISWTIVRAYNPNIEGTEKPMEFMMLNSILGSPTFPPLDAWLSNYAISYYYFGYVLIAAMTLITGVSSSVAFNLGIVLIFALTAVGVFGVLLNLIALVKQSISPWRELPKAKILRSSLFPAILGPLMVLIVGNFYGVLEIAHQQAAFGECECPNGLV